MSRYDATQSNESKRSAKIYRDLDLDFSSLILLQKIFRNFQMLRQ